MRENDTCGDIVGGMVWGMDGTRLQTPEMAGDNQVEKSLMCEYLSTVPVRNQSDEQRPV